MKKLYVLLTFLLLAITAQAQDAPFITTWEVTAGDLDITIPIYGGGYNYTVDFGDGTIETNINGGISHTYNNAGTYTVSISGDFPQIRFGNIYSDRDKIKSVEQWGDIQWQSMGSAFSGCNNLVINATDVPDLSQVTSIAGMFVNCIDFNSNINNWDVSNVTNMSYMFKGANSFNQPLNSWDVANVTEMEQIFSNADSFNQPLNNWDVSNVTNMQGMFRGAGLFNQPLNNWNVSNVTDMSSMFEETTFNQPLDNWDVSSVTSMHAMFSGANSFNQPLDNWDVSNVTNMGGMFVGTTFNQPLNNWDVSSVTNMLFMFSDASSFNQPLDNWDVSSVSSPFMNSMFAGASSFNQDLTSWQINTPVLNYFLNGSGLDVYNYDAFLAHLTTLEISGSLGAEGLEYCNELIRNQLIEELGWTIQGDSLAEDCTPYNLITGNVTYDENNDGCNIVANSFVINISNENIDIGLRPNNEGSYSFYVEEGNYEVSIANLQEFYTASPETTTVNFTGSASQEQIDFCITANQVIEDLNITLLPIEQARPGFEADYQLVVQNMGTHTVSNAEVNLSFDDTKQSFVEANQTPTAETENSLTFTVNELLPFQSQVIDLTMQTFEPPTVNGDDVLNFTASVSPDANDYTPEDNAFPFEQIVVNSFDPNDKQVLQGEEIYEDQTDEYLDYIIRFQNTGTASAINVKVLDTLDAKLDWNSLQMVNTSHNDYRVEITDGNKLAFIFDNINLPYEAQDEAGSHGFIAFKIKPRPAVELGDIILGKSYIYFDFNEPIITNEVSTEVVQRLGVKEYTLADQLYLYPNPTTNVLNIQTSNSVKVERVQLYNIQGKELLSVKGANVLHLENLSAGLYLLKITTNKGVLNQQIVKK